MCPEGWLLAHMHGKFTPCNVLATCARSHHLLAVQVWDFATCTEERVMTGHGGDVTSTHWHPSQGLIASGSKDLLIKARKLLRSAVIVQYVDSSNVLMH